jgi:hypothetical protein
MKSLTPALRNGDLAEVERGVVEQIRALPSSPFHVVLDLSITNDPSHAAAHFDRFFTVESRRFQLGAAYTEMNGFDINPDLWYCDLFAYPQDGGDEDHDWLSDWKSDRFDAYVITGLEELQAIYASAAFREKANRAASYVSSLLVVVKFQRFMAAAAGGMKQLRFPLYATAHDFDFISVVRPDENKS